MSWLSDYRQDIARYMELNRGPAWKQILTEHGLWALLQYRIEASVYRSELPTLIKKPLRLVLMTWHVFVEIFTGMSLPCTAQIGPGLHLPHCGSRIIHGSAKIGSNCCISQGVTIGVSGRREKRGVPIVGNRVYFGANSVVVGKIKVGDDVVIGANSLVNRDVPSCCTVMGVPATVINEKGSAEYIGLRNLPETRQNGAPPNNIQFQS